MDLIEQEGNIYGSSFFKIQHAISRRIQLSGNEHAIYYLKALSAQLLSSNILV